MSALQHLPFDAPLSDYEHQAKTLLNRVGAGDADAIGIVKRNHPRFLDEQIPWLQKKVSDQDVHDSALTAGDARLALARFYNFRDWASLEAYAQSVQDRESAAHRFEAAAEAVIHGDASALRELLARDPELVRARSARVCNFDPPAHRATLLHYIAANGVEGYRQKSPQNAPEIARILLETGADPDALAEMYGSRCSTMSMLVSSTPPAEARVQIALIDVLIDFGASPDARGEGNWSSPLITALVFEFLPAAEALLGRGAKVDHIVAAAGLGRVDDVRRMLAESDAQNRHAALAVAAQHGHAEVIALLLDSGVDPRAFNPPGTHAHSTPLHRAAFNGHVAVVRLLVERGADLMVRDRIYQSTPLGWAEHAGKTSVAAFLRSAGATS